MSNAQIGASGGGSVSICKYWKLIVCLNICKSKYIRRRLTASGGKFIYVILGIWQGWIKHRLEFSNENFFKWEFFKWDFPNENGAEGLRRLSCVQHQGVWLALLSLFNNKCFHFSIRSRVSVDISPVHSLTENYYTESLQITLLTRQCQNALLAQIAA